MLANQTTTGKADIAASEINSTESVTAGLEAIHLDDWGFEVSAVFTEASDISSSESDSDSDSETEKETRKPNPFVKWLSTMNARCRIADFAVTIHKAGDRKKSHSDLFGKTKRPKRCLQGNTQLGHRAVGRPLVEG